LAETLADSPSRESASPTQGGANGDINKRSLRVPSLGLNGLRTSLRLSIDPFAPPEIGEVVWQRRRATLQAGKVLLRLKVGQMEISTSGHFGCLP
jgi:hypothetical protein